MVIDRDDYSEPPMTVTYQHTLTADEARKRLDGFMFALKRQYGGRVAESSEAWEGNVLTYSIRGIRGRRIHGTVSAAAGSVTVEAHGDIPRIVEGKVRKEIEAALAEALGS